MNFKISLATRLILAVTDLKFISVLFFQYLAANFNANFGKPNFIKFCREIKVVMKSLTKPNPPLHETPNPIDGPYLPMGWAPNTSEISHYLAD